MLSTATEFKLCNGLNIADNRYFTFQTLINVAGACSAISDALCVGSPVIIIIYKKNLTNKYTKIFLEFSTRVETIANQEKVLKQVGV